MGICFYVPGGMVLLANHVMENFCERSTGGLLLSGEKFWERINGGSLSEGCQRVTIGNEIIIHFSDQTAWKLRSETVPHKGQDVCMLIALDISEFYQKTLELQKKQKKLSELGMRLAKVNEEIVALTADREILNAKVSVHDELGSNLLSLKRFILNGGTPQEEQMLIENLGHNLSFLKNDRPPAVRNEYELMIETAAQLGVSVLVEGTLQQTEPLNHIIATAIHECFTNTLRHAQGDILHVTVVDKEEVIVACFENNGKQPTSSIHEKGGLLSLRALVEQSGGSMVIRFVPTFAIILELPKEVNYVI